MEARIVETTSHVNARDSSTTILIDGGGTSTDVLVLHDGAVHARTTLSSFKPRLQDARTDDLCRALGTWIASSTAAQRMPTYVVVGMSGIWAPHEKQTYLNALTDSWMTYIGVDIPRMSILSDVELVHFAAYGPRTGTVLIAGTGSIAVYRTADGVLHRAGGWGPRIDDAGGGFWIGREALRAVAMMLDGRGPSTALVRPVAAYLRSSPDQHHELALALRRASVDHAARLAQAVLTYADEDDAVACAIRDRAIQELCALPRALAAHEPHAVDAIALSGSLFRSPSMATSMISALHQQTPRAEVCVVEDILASAAQSLIAQ